MILDKLNGWQLYLIAGIVILFICIYSLVVLLKAYKGGLAIGMDKGKLKTVIVSSASFTVLPSIAILLGIVALSGALGVPLPWLRLSVVGALHYEATVADIAAKSVGLSGLNVAEMTETAFATIALLVSVGIIWGATASIFAVKKYAGKFVLSEASEIGGKKKKSKFAGFGDIAIVAMFVGMCCSYIGSYIGQYIQMQNGKLVITGEYLQLVAMFASAITMYILVRISEKTKKVWIDNFALALAMLVGMAAAVIVGLFI